MQQQEEAEKKISPLESFIEAQNLASIQSQLAALSPAPSPFDITPPGLNSNKAQPTPGIFFLRIVIDVMKL